MAVQRQKRQPIKAAVTRSGVHFVIAVAFLWGLYPLFADLKAVYRFGEESRFLTSNNGKNHEFLLTSCVPNNNDPDGHTCKAK